MSDIDAIEWPPHRGGLYITHNEHGAHYLTVAQALWRVNGKHRPESPYDCEDFPDMDEISRSVAQDSVWTVTWYPDNPIGSYRVHAATLSRALEEIGLMLARIYKPSR